jgi:hypothetical protein
LETEDFETENKDKSIFKATDLPVKEQAQG